MALHQWKNPYPDTEPQPAGIFDAYQINRIEDLDVFIASVRPEDLHDESIAFSNLVNAGESDGMWTLTFDMWRDGEGTTPMSHTAVFESYLYVSRQDFTKVLNVESECSFESRFEPVA